MKTKEMMNCSQTNTNHASSCDDDAYDGGDDVYASLISSLAFLRCLCLDNLLLLMMILVHQELWLVRHQALKLVL